jgi:hypothetical protein
MRCVVCGATMRLEEIVPAKIIRAPGYEYRSFRCWTCSAVERRLAFTRRSNSPPTLRHLARLR